MAKPRSEKVRNHIPNDLAFSVLSKLPLKSLKRFGCVCQTWALLFENSHFMSKFCTNFISNSRSYYNDDTSLLLYKVVRSHDHSLYCSLYTLSGKRYANRVKLEYPNPFQDPYFELFDCDTITGTICLKLGNTLVFWNPTIHELKVIPPSPAESPSPYRQISAVYHGFGYDPTSGDIKIIRFLDFCRTTSRALQHLNVGEEDVPWNEISYEPLWEIYSLRCNSWMKLDFDIPKLCYDSSEERLYKDGVCHWWFESKTREQFLVSFNLSNETFFTTEIPLDIHPDRDSNLKFRLLGRHLVMFNGSIASILWYSTTFHILILGELGMKESWTKLFVVGPFPHIERVIGTGKNGDIFFKTKDGELVLFDLSTQIFEDMSIKGGHRFNIAIYKENHILKAGIKQR
jgi:molecular chaperone HtpG